MLLGVPGRLPVWAATCLALFALAGVRAAPADASVTQPWLTASGTAFVDPGGNPVLLRGVNVFPATSQGEADAEAAFWTTEAASSEADYAAFARMMVERYSAYPAVIGFGIFNEPHAGSLGATTAATNTILRWQADVARDMHAVD